MKRPSISLTEMDYNRLNSLIENILNRLKKEKSVEDLEDEIDRARILDFPEIPTDLVTMNTRFLYLNVTDNIESEMTIVYPAQADLKKRWISVTAPLGAALIGPREGDMIKWDFPDGKKRTLKIIKVIYQPEANNDLAL